MSWREHGKYILMALIAISLAIFVIVLLFKNIGGSGTPTNDRKDVVEFIDTQSTMELTVQGPIVADEDYRSAKVSVSATDVRIELRAGYENRILTTKTYQNNADAYSDFIHALSIMNFAHGDTNKDRANESGFCPTGNRYIYGIQNNGSEVQRFWSASCTAGTFGGQAARVRALFRAQIPDFTTLVSETEDFSLAW